MLLLWPLCLLPIVQRGRLPLGCPIVVLLCRMVSILHHPDVEPRIVELHLPHHVSFPARHVFPICKRLEALLLRVKIFWVKLLPYSQAVVDALPF